MDNNSSSTVDASSEIVTRLKLVLQNEEEKQIEQRDQLRSVQHKIDNLRSRGLLKKAEFRRTTSSEFENLYIHKK
jgi:ribosomal protein S20